MTLTALPINASAGVPAYTARQTRQAFAALMMPGPGPLRTRSGFRPGGAPTVSVTPTTWSVGPFSAIVDAWVSTTQGPYLVASDATEVGAMTPADGTFARKDILYVQVDDTDEDGSGQRRAQVLYLAGVPASSPTAPATPARSLLVGTIDVPKVGSGDPVFTSSGQYAVTAGGVMPATAATVQPTGDRYDGLMTWRTDARLLHLWDGSSSRVVWDAALPAQSTIDNVLGETWYGVGVTYTVRSNLTNGRADVDAAMTLTFTAPDTGRVWIELEGMAATTGVTSGTGVFGTYWCLKDNNGGGLVTNSSLPMLPTQDTQATRLRYSTKVTGLTPGQSYTYTWQHFRGSGATGTAWWYIGGGITALMRARRAI